MIDPTATPITEEELAAVAGYLRTHKISIAGPTWNNPDAATLTTEPYDQSETERRRRLNGR